MIIKFEMPLEECGGIDAFDTDAATHEELTVACAALAQAVNRLKRGSKPRTKAPDARDLALEIGAVIGGANVTQAVAVDALTIQLAGVLGTLDHATEYGLELAVRGVSKQILELALRFRASDHQEVH